MLQRPPSDGGREARIINLERSVRRISSAGPRLFKPLLELRSPNSALGASAPKPNDLVRTLTLSLLQLSRLHTVISGGHGSG